MQIGKYLVLLCLSLDTPRHQIDGLHLFVLIS